MTRTIKSGADEPEAICANCDYHDNGICHAVGSIWFGHNPASRDSCDKFWPDHRRWSNVDDD